MPQVFIAGPASWNELVRLDELPAPVPQTVVARQSRSTLGGTSAGKALNLAGLGIGTVLRTVVGQDGAGAKIQAELTAAGVSLICEDASGGSERHLNLMDGSGGRISIYLATAAMAPGPGLHDDAAIVALLAADAVVIDLADHARPFLKIARNHGRAVWCDIHDFDGESDFHAEFIDAATYLFLNEDGFARRGEPGALEDFMATRIAAGAQAVVVTEGARGARALTADGRWHHVPAAKVSKIIDANGAGDAFLSGVLAACLSTGPQHTWIGSWPEALAAGAAQAARCLTSESLAPPPLEGASRGSQPG